MTDPVAAGSGAVAKGPRRLWLVGLVIAVAAAGAWYSASRRSAAPSEDVVVGQGRPLLLEFGMGVCAQCKRMKPVMERAARTYGSEIGVHILDIRQEKNELLADRFELRTIPLVVLVDGAGKEVWRHDGFVAFDELSLAVDRFTRPTTD